MDTVFEYSFLASYFMIDDLNVFIDTFISTQKPSQEWLYKALEDGNTFVNLDFVDIIAKHLRKLESFPHLALCPEVCARLAKQKVDPIWLLKSIVFSFTERDVEKSIWNNRDLELCLCGVKLSSSLVDEVFSVISPLLNDSTLFNVTTTFILKILSNHTSSIPIPRLRSFIQSVNESRNEVFMKQLAELSHVFLSEGLLNSLALNSLSPKFVEILLENIVDPELVTMVVKSILCTIRTVNRRAVSTKRVLALRKQSKHFAPSPTFLNWFLQKVTVSSENAHDIYEVLEPLSEDVFYGTLVNKFIASNLFPLIE
ncbi:hypothetical protein RCL1_001578 [Eukaryota sp. TZLM3-RCL]